MHKGLELGEAAVSRQLLDLLGSRELIAVDLDVEGMVGLVGVGLVAGDGRHLGDVVEVARVVEAVADLDGVRRQISFFGHRPLVVALGLVVAATGQAERHHQGQDRP